MNTVKLVIMVFAIPLIVSCSKRQDDPPTGAQLNMLRTAEKAKEDLNSKTREMEQRTKEAMDALNGKGEVKR